MYRKIEDMMWPVPCESMSHLEWKLRYGEPTKGDLLQAAEIIAAYHQMIFDIQKKRNMVVDELRKGPG